MKTGNSIFSEVIICVLSVTGIVYYSFQSAHLLFVGVTDKTQVINLYNKLSKDYNKKGFNLFKACWIKSFTHTVKLDEGLIHAKGSEGFNKWGVVKVTYSEKTWTFIMCMILGS